MLALCSLRSSEQFFKDGPGVNSYMNVVFLVRGKDDSRVVFSSLTIWLAV